MVKKTVLEAEIKKLRKNIKQKRKLIKIGVQAIKEKDTRIAQLASLLEDKLR
jgi:hypothetical protein